MWLYGVLVLVVLQRLGELVLAQRNTTRLLDSRYIEVGPRHYPLIVLLHASWLLAIALTVPPQTAPNLFLLMVFLVLQAARVWILASLGPRWTTRIIVPKENTPLVSIGPYRWFSHPNYMVVVAEIAVLPLIFGAMEIAVVFTILNGILLWHRVRVENQALGRT